MIKKALFVVAALCGMAYAACNGPFCWDDTGASIQARVASAGPIGLASDTSANILARSGDPAGSMMYCSNCVTLNTGNVCVSTGTALRSYVHNPSTSTVCN